MLSRYDTRRIPLGRAQTLGRERHNRAKVEPQVLGRIVVEPRLPSCQRAGSKAIGEYGGCLICGPLNSAENDNKCLHRMDVIISFRAVAS